MNYFAHALPLLEAGGADPYELAGVAVPDWLSVAARKTKCRSKHAAPHIESKDSRLAALARGIVRHHTDDGWFHESPAFGELSLRFAKRLRLAMGEQTSMRPWFLGHILVELLLDDALIRRDPVQLDRYYELIGRADPEFIATSVAQMAGGDVGRMAEFIPKYVEMRFLADYAEDERLTLRLNQVMRRARLNELPPEAIAVFPECRADIAASVDALISRKT